MKPPATRRPAAQRWAAALAQWAIPDSILERAPESPWTYPPQLFAPLAGDGDSADAPSYSRALEALPAGGTVLDVGAGVGRSSLPLAPRAGHVTAVDERDSMLVRFAEAAEAAGVPYRTVLGTWPEIAPDAGVADVVVCHHVFYNVPDLGPFAEALTRAARARVVVELTKTHPQSSLNDLWLHFHGLERPRGPTHHDAVAVLQEIGYTPEVTVWTRARGLSTIAREDAVAFARRRLCLPPERDPEISVLLEDDDVWRPKDVATLWWAGSAG